MKHSENDDRTGVAKKVRERIAAEERKQAQQRKAEKSKPQ